MNTPHAARRADAKAECERDVLAYVAAHADMSATAIRVETNWNATTVRNVLAALVADGRIVSKATTGADTVFELAAPVAPAPTDDAIDVAIDETVLVALVLDATYHELFAAVDNGHFGGNGGTEIDDLLDASLTRLIDAGTVSAIDTPATEPGMLSTRTYHRNVFRCTECHRIVDDAAETLCPRCLPAPRADGERIRNVAAAYLLRQHATSAECAEPITSITLACGEGSVYVSEREVRDALLADTESFLPRNGRHNSFFAVVAPEPVDTVTATDEILSAVPESADACCQCGGSPDDCDCECACDDSEPEPTESDMRALADTVLAVLAFDPALGKPFHEIRASVGHRVGTVSERDLQAALVLLVNDASVVRREVTSGAVVFKLARVVALDETSVPSNRERRVSASRAFQAATRSTRRTIRSTAEGTPAPFAGIVIDTVTARLAARRLDGSFIPKLDASLAPDADTAASDWHTAFGARARAVTVERGTRAPLAGVLLSPRQAVRILRAL
jgi:hypothetical protein